MASEQEDFRDWHRLFGLLLTDYFTDSPFAVDVERDMSVQQQFLDVVIVRRGRGRFAGRLPDGLEGLRTHNLVTFKSRHEALDAWAMKELVQHDVAYRKLVSPSPNRRLPNRLFGLYAVTARFPHNLSGQVPWLRVQAGVYDCTWGTDTIRVVVAGELPREPHNAPLHLFSASPELVEFGQGAYRRRSVETSLLLRLLLEKLGEEGFAMSYTMEDFKRDYVKKHFAQLTPQEQREALQALPLEKQQEVLEALPQEVVDALPPEKRLAGLPPEQRLAGLSAEQIQKYLKRLTATDPASPRKPRRKK
jgi:hypothetical protein